MPPWKARDAFKESTAALVDARHNARRSKDRSFEVHRISRELRILREQNHFAEQLEAIMGGRT